MSVQKYISQRDINKYSVYNDAGDTLIKQTLNHAINETINFAKKEYLQPVISFAEEKIQELPKKQELYYLYGQNTIDLTAKFFASGGYDVVRKDNIGSQIITLGIVPVITIPQYSNFNMQSICYYMLASERIIISANNLVGQQYKYTSLNQVIINHNLSGIIDFSIRQFDEINLSSSCELYVNNSIIDNCNLKLELAFNKTKSYQVIIWKLDQFDSKIYKNVFTTYEYKPSDVDWSVFSNDQQYQLGLNYRFSFISYLVQHQALINKKDLVITQDINNLSTTVASGANQLLPFAKTLNRTLRIQKNFSYVLNQLNQKSDHLTHLLKVILPNFQRYDHLGVQCQSIFVYSSLFSETVFFENPNKNLIITINHKLNGKVKAVIRNLRTDLYKTYYINDNTIKIEFLSFKLPPIEGLVDLFLIWSKDNNEI